MKSRNARKRSRRTALFHQQGGRCHWCGGAMKLFHKINPEETQQDDWCTLEHLRDKFDPRRLEPSKKGERRLVAACRRCNHDRGRIAVAANLQATQMQRAAE